MATDLNDASNGIPVGETISHSEPTQHRTSTDAQTSSEHERPIFTATGPDEDEEHVVTFRSATSNKTWKHHPSTFKDHSNLFIKMIEFDTTLGKGADPCDRLPGIQRVHGPPRCFQLKPSISDFDFEAFLLGIKLRPDHEPGLDQLRPMLILATDWHFHGIREYAISKIECHSMDPADKVFLAKRANVAGWIRDPLIAMSVGLAPLVERETEILGNRASGAVSQAREAVLRRRLGLLHQHDTGVMVWKWITKHGACRETRSQAWRSVLADDRWWGMSPLDAMHEATKDNFCHECRAELHGWLRLDDDNGVAENTVRQHLGDEPETWIHELRGAA